MPRNFSLMDRDVFRRVQNMMKANMIDKPVWYDAALQARPYAGPLKYYDVKVKNIRFRSDFLMRKFYRRFPWAKAQEVYSFDDRETLSPARQFATKVAKLIEVDKMDEDEAFRLIEKEYVDARVEWLRHREKVIAKAMETDPRVEIAMVSAFPDNDLDPEVNGTWPPYNNRPPGMGWNEPSNYPLSEFQAADQEKQMAIYNLRFREERDEKIGKFKFEEEYEKAKSENRDPNWVTMKDFTPLDRAALFKEQMEDKKLQWIKRQKGKKRLRALVSLRDDVPLQKEENPHDILFKDRHVNNPLDHSNYNNNSSTGKGKVSSPWGDWEWTPYHTPIDFDEKGKPKQKSQTSEIEHWDEKVKYDPEKHGNALLTQQELIFNDESIRDVFEPLDITDAEINEILSSNNKKIKGMYVVKQEIDRGNEEKEDK